MEISVDVILALMAVAALAGLIDAIAGGGGLLTVPALLLAGLDPVSALATNKLQGTFSVGSSVIAFARGGHIQWWSVWPMAIVAFLASILGALAITILPAPQIERFLPFLLIALAFYFLLSPRLGDVAAKPRLSAPSFTATAIPAVGLYDGAFGPAAGSFYMLAFVALRGDPALKATAHTKLMNFASNLGGLFLFALAGKPVWIVGFAMAVSAAAGARIGSGLAMANGSRLIRPLLVFVCTAMALRLVLAG